jgi:hypothetical protein
VQDNPNPGGLFGRPDLVSMYRIGYGMAEDYRGLFADALWSPAAMIRRIDGRENAPPALTTTDAEIELRTAAGLAGMAQAFEEAAAVYHDFLDGEDDETD